MKLYPNLIFAVPLLVASLYALEQTSAPFFHQYRGRALAYSVAANEGVAEWPIESETAYHDQVRLLYRNPNDSGAFADIYVERKGSEWAVTQVNKDFRPW